MITHISIPLYITVKKYLDSPKRIWVFESIDYLYLQLV